MLCYKKKKVQPCIPEHFNPKSTSCISYKYTTTFTSKLFNYKPTLQGLHTEHLLLNPSTCSYSSFCSNYQLAGYVVTGPVNIHHVARNEELKSLILRALVFQMTAELYFYYRFCKRLCQPMSKIRKRITWFLVSMG
jgi:hypothetical protein